MFKKIIPIICFMLFSSAVQAINLWDTRQLFIDEQYDILEKQFKYADESFFNETPLAYLEYRFVYASLFKSTDIGSSLTLERLEKWKDLRPDSYAPLLALGKYYFQSGWRSRGRKFANKTSKKQFRKMKAEHKKSYKYFMLALEKDPSSTHTIESLVDLKRTLRKSNTLLTDIICSLDLDIALLIRNYLDCDRPVIEDFSDEWFEKSKFDMRKSVAVWAAYIRNNQPRWGGSELKHKQLLDKAKEFLSKSDMLLLSGYVLSDKLDAMSREGYYEEAVQLGLEYIEKNEINQENYFLNHYAFYKELADANKMSGDFSACVKYADLASRISPWNAYAWETYGYCAHHAKEWGQAHYAFKYNAETRQLNAQTLFYLGESFRYIGQWTEAYTLFKRANKLDPIFFEYSGPFMTWLESKHPDKAVELKKSNAAFIGDLKYEGAFLDIKNRNKLKSS